MRKKICVQGLGFVGFAMAVAVANVKDKFTSSPLYDVVGIDLPNESGIKKIKDINCGKVTISCNHKKLINAYKTAIPVGNIKA